MLSNSAPQLRAFIERIERLNEEEKSIKDDKRDLYAEAKSTGFDAKAIRKIVQIRGQDVEKREEFETIVETYMRELGMIPAHARDAREGDARVIISAQEASSPSAAQAEGATCENQEEGDDVRGGEASPAAAQVHRAVQSSQFGAGSTGEDGRVEAGILAPPFPASPGRLSDPRPVAPTVGATIDLTIPAFLDRRTPEQKARSL